MDPRVEPVQQPEQHHEADRRRPERRWFCRPGVLSRPAKPPTGGQHGLDSFTGCRLTPAGRLGDDPILSSPDGGVAGSRGRSYGEIDGSAVVHQVSRGEDVATRTSGSVAAVAASGTLPFTGVSLVWVVLAALMLLLLGLGFMGLGRRRHLEES